MNPIEEFIRTLLQQGQSTPSGPLGMSGSMAAGAAPSMSVAIPGFQPPSASGGAGLPLTNEDQMERTGSVNVMGRPIAPTPAMPTPMPRAVQPAFRTPDLLGLILMGLSSGRNRADVGRGVMGAKLNKAQQDTQASMADWQSMEQERMRVANEGARQRSQLMGWAHDDEQSGLDRASREASARIGAASRESVAGIGAGIKRDANRVAMFKTILQAAPPEARPDIVRTFEKDADFAEAMGTMTPKEGLQTAQAGLASANAGFVAGPKSDLAKAQAGKARAQTKEIETLAPYKVREFISKGDLRSAQGEAQRATADFRRVSTRLMPTMQAARIQKMQSDADSARRRADADMVRSTKTAGGQSGAPTPTFVANLRRGIDKTEAENHSYRYIIDEYEFAAKNGKTRKGIEIDDDLLAKMKSAALGADAKLAMGEAWVERANKQLTEIQAQGPKADSGEWRRIALLADTKGFRVTGGYDKTGQGHNDNSKHYSGNAVDLSVKGKSDAEVDAIIAYMQSNGYRVIDERTKPRGRKWSAPHIHVETP